MYLLDTNIWLELLLNQKKADEVVKFLDFIKNSKICVSSFSIFSICILLSKHHRFDTLLKFINDLSENNVEIINISLSEIRDIFEIEKHII